MRKMKRFEKFQEILDKNQLSKIFGGNTTETVDTNGYCYTDTKTTTYDDNCNIVKVCVIKLRETCY
jgi:hypothetical protein